MRQKHIFCDSGFMGFKMMFCYILLQEERQSQRKFVLALNIYLLSFINKIKYYRTIMNALIS